MCQLRAEVEEQTYTSIVIFIYRTRSGRETDWSGENAEFTSDISVLVVERVNCRQLCCRLTFKFIEIVTVVVISFRSWKQLTRYNDREGFTNDAHDQQVGSARPVTRSNGASTLGQGGLQAPPNCAGPPNRG